MNTQFFPALYEISLLKEDSFWQEQFDANSEESCANFIYYCESELQARGNGNGLQNIASAAINDILSLKSKQEDTVIFDFLQFCLATLVGNFLGNNKQTGYTYNWIANSLSDEVGTEPSRSVDAGRIYDFILSGHPFIHSRLMLFLPLWVRTVYYYSRISGGHNVITEGFLENYGNYYFSQGFRSLTTEFLQSACDILAWCILNGVSNWQTRIQNALNKLYQLPACTREYKKIIAMQFSCITNPVGGLSQQEWSDVVLQDFGEELRSSVKVQIITNAIYQDIEKIIRMLPEYKTSIRSYIDSLNLSETNSNLIGYELSRMFEVITPVIITMLKSGEGRNAFDIVSLFFNVKNPQGSSEQILQIVPNDISGPLYTFQQKTFTGEIQDASPQYVEMVKKLNLFLQSSVFLTGLLEYQPEEPPGERVGAPLEQKSSQYFAALSEYFKFDDLQVNLKDAIAYYLYSSINFPLQAIMISQLGFAIPMTQSLQQPEDAREIKSVLIWQDDSMTSGLECDAVIHIFSTGGITTKLLVAGTNTLDEFKAAYESDEFDLMYICAHGQHDHYEPHASYIQLSHDIKLDSEAIRGFHNGWKNRRLAFLNICDGATTALFNSPVSLGMSPELVHSKQSVISHHWPVVPKVALLFGVLVANAIVRKLSYLDIFQEAMLKVLAGKDSALEYLRPSLDADTIERITNMDLDTTNFTHWGSLAYFV